MSEQEEGENCLMTEAGMSLPFPLQSFLSPAPFPSPNKSFFTPSLAGWEGVRVAISAGWGGAGDLSGALGDSASSIYRSVWMGWFYGLGEKKKNKRQVHFR